MEDESSRRDQSARDGTGLALSEGVLYAPSGHRPLPTAGKNDGNDETVAQLDKTGYVGSQEDMQDYFWGAGLPCILRILPDPPAKRILFFFLCNGLIVSIVDLAAHPTSPPPELRARPVPSLAD